MWLFLIFMFGRNGIVYVYFVLKMIEFIFGMFFLLVKCIVFVLGYIDLIEGCC